MISSSDFFQLLVNVNWSSNFGWLSIDGNNDGGCLVVHSNREISVSNIFDGLPSNLFNVDLSRGTNFSEDHAEWVLDSTFTCNLSFRINSQAGIEYRVRDIVTKFIGVTTRNILWGEKEMSWFNLKIHGCWSLVYLFYLL